MYLFRNHTRRRIEHIVRGASFAVLLLILLLTGCSESGSAAADTDDFVLEGKWKSPYDSYTITKTTVDYLMDNSLFNGNNTILKGSIEKSVSFSDNAGVLIIKVTESQDDLSPFNVNRYAGVYYKEGTKTTIKMATAFNADYSALETDTLTEAQALFTVDNADTHVSMWGSYTK